MKSVIYLNCDTPVNSGLFKDQVLKMLNFSPKGVNMSVVNVANLNSMFSSKNSYTTFYGFPMRWANKVFGLFFLIISSLIIAFLLRFKFRNADFFVARGYYGGLIGFFLSLFGSRFIWDPRSIYPLEQLDKGFFKKNTFPLKFWYFLEKISCKTA